MTFHISAQKPSKAWKKAVDPKVTVRVREYLERFAGGLPDDITDQVAKKVLLDRFGYSDHEGKRLAAHLVPTIQQELEAERAKPIHVPFIQPKEYTRIDVEFGFVNAMRVIKPRTRAQKTVDNRLRKREKKGLYNEKRFHELMTGLTRILSTTLPDRIKAAAAVRSEHHDPLKGIADFRDHDGEDVALEIVISSGAMKLLIYDVKSGQVSADIFNSSVRRIFHRQEAASLKKAIVVNDKRRDGEIILEVIDDLIRVGIVPEEARYDLYQAVS